MFKKVKFWKGAIFTLITALVLTACVIVVSAYYMSRVYLYTDDGDKTLFHVGMELNTFFDDIDSAKVTDGTDLKILCTDTDCGTLYESGAMSDGVVYYSQINVGTTETPVYENHYVYNSGAAWGSASRPYIISRINHLQNLYVLQNLGFFSTNYYGKDGAGETEADLPYFLVSTDAGAPASIDGTDKIFEYIGNNEYPFIGYLGGAFVDGTATVNGKSSTQSAIYNLTVQTDDAVIDVGLFGQIGYLGTLPASTEVGETFDGVVSTVRDLLLYDVKVKVENKSVWTAILEKTAHLFSFSDAEEGDEVPHETHHIGILAGHVEFATVEYISVYYSNDDTPAFDVDLKTRSDNDVSANFFSVSGILGFVHNMNSTQADGKVTIGGTSNSDITVSSGGEGTGGGLLSGAGRGYVTAAEIFQGFKSSGKIVKVTKTANDKTQTVYYGLLVQCHDQEYTFNNYQVNGSALKTDATLADGTPVTYPADLSYVRTYSIGKTFFNTDDVQTQDWTYFVVHFTSESLKGTSEEYAYRDADGNIIYASQEEISVTGVSLRWASHYDDDEATWTSLCQQYERERLVGGTQQTGRFYFYDGVFTFSLSEQSDTIEETWKDGTPDKLVVGPDNDTSWTQDTAGLANSVLAFLKPVTTVDELQKAKYKGLYIAYKENNTYHIVTLAENSGYTAGGRDNASYTKKTTLTLADASMTDAIGTAIQNGTLTFTASSNQTTKESLKTDWAAGNIQVLNLGTMENTQESEEYWKAALAELANRYQVEVDFRSEEPFAGYFEDDGTTAIAAGALSKLQVSAKGDTTGTYYSMAQISEAYDTTSQEYQAYADDTGNPVYGAGFTFFTLEATATADVASIVHINDEIDNNNKSYTCLETGHVGASVNITAMQNAISERANEYYNLSGVKVTLSTILADIQARNSKYYLSGTTGAEISTSTVQSAITALNGKYFDLNGAEIDVSGILAHIENNNGHYLALGTANGKDNTAIGSIANIYNNIANNINKYYYWPTSSNVTEQTDSSNGTKYYKLTSTASSTDLSTVTSSAKSARSSSNYYESDGTLINSSSVLSPYLSTMTNGSGTLLTQSEKHKWGYLAFETHSAESDGLYKKCTCQVFYIDANGTKTSIKDPTSYITTRSSGYRDAEGYTDYLLGQLGISKVGEKHGQTVYKLNGTNYEGPLFYLEGGTYYSSCKFKTGVVIQPAGNTMTLSNGSYSSPAFTEEYHYIVEKISGAGVNYYLDGKSKITAAPTATGAKISSINGWSLYGKDFDLYSCSYGGTTYQCILIVNVDVGGTFIKTTTGGNFAYSFYDGSSTTSVSAPSAISTVPASFATISVDGANRQLYSDGTHLGVMLTNFCVDGILLESLSGGGGTEYNVINGSGKILSTWSGTSAVRDIGKTVTEGGITYNIYRSSDGKLGVKAKNAIIDGILLETYTASGWTYSLLKPNNGGTVTGLSSASTDKGTQLVDGVSYHLYVRDQKLGVRLKTIALDGIQLETLTGGGYTYSQIAKTNATAASGTASFTSTEAITLGSTTYQLAVRNSKLGIRVENERVDGVLLQTRTGSGYKYYVIAPNGTVSSEKSWSASNFTKLSSCHFELEKKIGSYDLYTNGGFLGIRLENEQIDGIFVTSDTGHGYQYSLYGSSDEGFTQPVTALNSAEPFAFQNTLTVEGVTYTVYQNNGKLGIRAANFVIDGTMLQTQTGTGVTYTLVSKANPTGDGTATGNLTFTKVAGKTVTADGVTHDVYKSSNGHYCVRVANIKLDGYAVSEVKAGSATRYDFYPNNGGSATILAAAPKLLAGITVPLSDGTNTKNYRVYVCDGKLGVEFIHVDNGARYYYTFSHDGNAASSGEEYYLRLLYREYDVGEYYGMICATDSRVENNSTNKSYFGVSYWPGRCQTLTNSTDATVILNGDGTAYIQYTVSGGTRYLSYHSNSGYFNTSSSQDSTSRLYLFTAEGTHTASFGEHILPNAGSSSYDADSYTTYGAEQYVLWPNQAYVAGVDSTSAYKPSTSGRTTDPTYSIKSLATLANDGWIDKSGNPLYNASAEVTAENPGAKWSDLSSVFSLGDGIAEVSISNILFGNTGTIPGADSYVKAPLGTSGDEAYIPTGCVAFRVMKNLSSNKIRVIVAVPISEYYYGEAGDGMDYDDDYYFCMWKIDEANSTSSQTINIGNCNTAFELPRSTPYSANTIGQSYVVGSAGDATAVCKYITVTNEDGTNQRRAYLNGEQVLVAYEFDAKEAGVYLLGSTKECRIVYFSADATASSGKDGVSNYKIGTIDFVYDNAVYSIANDGSVSGTAGNKVITIRDTNKTDDNVVNYNQYYYASLDLLYIANSKSALSTDTDKDDNGFPNVNNFLLYVKRIRTQKTEGGTTVDNATVYWQAKNYTDTAADKSECDASYLASFSYSLLSDPLSRKDNDQVVRATDESGTE